jgi:hypothetical protein
MIAFLFDVYLPILFLLVWSKSLFELLQRLRVAGKKTLHSFTKCMSIPSGNSCALGSGENANRGCRACSTTRRAHRCNALSRSRQTDGIGPYGKASCAA